MTEEFEITQELSEDEIEYKKRWVLNRLSKLMKKIKS